MADPTVDPNAPPQVPIQATPPPDVPPVQTATPVLAKQRPNYRPNALGLIQDLIKPPQQAQPGQMARPVSRLDTFEHFLGNFLDAFGQGMANSGHGPGANIRGAGAAIEAPYQRQAINTQLANTQAQTQEAQSRAALTAAQAQPINVPGVGQIPAGSIGPYFGMQGRLGAAQIQSQGRIGIAQMQLMAATGQVAKIVPVQDENGQLTMRMLNKYGQPIGDVAGALPPAQYLNKQTTTGEWKELEDGSLQYLPKTTTTGPQLPQRGAPGTLGGAAIPVGSGGLAAAGYQPAASGFPRQAAKSGGQQYFGKTAADVGMGFDPQSNEWKEVSRKDAASQGLQNFRKYAGGERESDRQLNNRLYDVANKMTRYQDSFAAPISDSDRGAIAGLLSKDTFKLGAFGAEIPVDRLNQALDKENVKNLSAAGKQRLLAYLNARESISGYQRVLSGSGRGSDSQMALNLDTVPSPVMQDEYTKEGIKQFLENVDYAGQGLPRMPGVSMAKDVLHPQSASGFPRKGSSTVDSLIQRYKNAR